MCGSPADLDPVYASARLYRCSRCDFLFSGVRSAEELRELYDAEYFDEYTGGGSYDQDPAQRRYEAKLRVDFIRGFVGSGRLLEIGAASGYFLDAAKSAGFAVSGIEPVAEIAEQARAQFGIDIAIGFVEDIALDPGSLDVVCAWHVLEHLRDPAQAVQQVVRALAPGGYLIVEVPNIDSAMARRRKLRWRPLELLHHVGHYNAKAIAALFERSGLTVVHTETFPAIAYARPATALRPLVAAAQVKESLSLRTVPRRAHPSKHEFLRVIAQTSA